MARIEVQDEAGQWLFYTTVSNEASNIRLALSESLKSEMASFSRKARAVDDVTGIFIDMANG
ncbi:MAG: hypothetical protein ABR89_01500 [Rhodobacter sp. BACL10 MAG-120910-bin24]|jgi:hypothetical protein|nr:MAG: hypothetical protein ABR89_01500 [Rhodobacter sp. BACL10 MAG-120910-bin24]